MQLQSISGELSLSKSKTLVAWAFQQDKKAVVALKKSGHEEALQLIQDAIDQKRLKAGSKETVFFRACKASAFENLLVVGLGDEKSINEETLRIASAVTVKTLAREKIESAVLLLESFRKLTKSAEAAGRAVAEGALLGNYKFDEFKSKKKEEDQGFKTLFLHLSDKGALQKFEAGVNTGTQMAEATIFTRNLGNTPPNLMTPTILSERAEKACKELKIKFKSLGKKEIKALKMGCFLAVNQGSDEEPRFIVLEYSGAPKTKPPIVLVGKGVTFDTGGISIKPAANMDDMRFDMSGSGAVIGATLALAKLKAKVNVVALAPLTENMPSGKAIKPGDVATSMNGKTVEILNTDAEGRLILADAITYACRNYKPAAILDIATLTGACVVALGNVYGGFFSNNEKLTKTIVETAQQTGEKFWQLPLSEEYADDMKGTYADLSNIGGGKGGGSSQAAAFLAQFVENDIPWAHFDIAGVAYHTGGRIAYNPDKGASGSGVRLLADLAIQLTTKSSS